MRACTPKLGENLHSNKDPAQPKINKFLKMERWVNLNRWKDLSLTILKNNNLRTCSVWWRGRFLRLKITSMSWAFFQGVPNNLWFLPALSWMWFTCQTSWVNSDEPFTHISDKNWLSSRARSWILDRGFKTDMKRKSVLRVNALLWEMSRCS